VGLRVAAKLPSHIRKIALSSSPQRLDLLQAQGIEVLMGNLDESATLRRLAGLGQRVLHLAPPASDQAGGGRRDGRTANLLQALRRRGLPKQFVYASTTGVYGDCQGAWISEARPLAPLTPRAMRRVDAERQIKRLALAGVASSILRIPGIYAPDREGGTPRARLEKGQPALWPQDDVYTNHIHADDLARACIAALWRGKAARAYNVCDDSSLKMGEYFDLAADLYGLPRPPRISRAKAQSDLSPVRLSFMSESRRLINDRMKRELRVSLRYPHVLDGLGA